MSTSMPIKFRCPCGKILHTAADQIGKKTRCPGCMLVLLVPGTPVEAAPSTKPPSAETAQEVDPNRTRYSAHIDAERTHYAPSAKPGHFPLQASSLPSTSKFPRPFGKFEL